MEMVFKGVVGDELIDQNSLPVCNAIPGKGDEVAVVDAANDFNLCLKLTLSLPTVQL